MPGSLVDTSVWIAALFSSHPAHARARQVLAEATPAAPAAFCRATEQSFLRLATTPALLKAYGAEGLSNHDALVALQGFMTLPQICRREEPPGMAELWHRLADRATASPKVWMDAYLAAFAIQGGLRLVTFDRDFTGLAEGKLQLLLLDAG